MSSLRDLPLYDDSLTHGTWCERMTPGEYAVHYSSFSAAGSHSPYCTVLDSLDAAVAYAKQQVQERPTLGCTIFDHRGFVGAPLREIRGSEFKDRNTISPRIRRWGGAILFFGGIILTILDWRTDFELQWPGMIGTRIFFPGLGLLLMDLFITINHRKKLHEAAQQTH